MIHNREEVLEGESRCRRAGAGAEEEVQEGGRCGSTRRRPDWMDSRSTCLHSTLVCKPHCTVGIPNRNCVLREKIVFFVLKL